MCLACRPHTPISLAGLVQRMLAVHLVLPRLACARAPRSLSLLPSPAPSLRCLSRRSLSALSPLQVVYSRNFVQQIKRIVKHLLRPAHTIVFHVDASAGSDYLVRQLRHHFGPFLARFSAPPHPTRAVGYALLGAHADRVLIGAWNPMVVTNLGLQAHRGARPRRVRAGVLRHLQGVPRRGGAAEMLRRRALRRLVLRQDSGAAAREAGASKGRAAGGVRAAQQHRHTLISGLVLRCRGTDWVVCRGVGALVAVNNNLIKTRIFYIKGWV